MRIGSIFREAGEALRFNRQRSLLTTISLAWGVACFVILYSYGDGFHLALRVAFQQVGQDLVLMFGGQTSTQAGGERAGRRIRLERSDVDAIRESVPMVAAISPEMMMGGMTVVRGYRTSTTMVRAVSASYGRIRNQTIAMGRWLAPEDEVQKQRVVVLGANAAQKLFGEIPPEGEEITINGLRFTVVGVLKTKTQIANYNTPDNDCGFIPFETGSLFRDLKYPDDLAWMPANPVFREQTVQQVRETLARIHNFSPNDERAVKIFVFNESMRLVDTMGIALRLLLGFIGTLTLAIGGVGLTNIMLVSVTQRTREIGVLMSIGATRRSILAQFLLEAMAIVTGGGAIGVLVGWALTSLLGTLPLLGPLFKDNGGSGDIHLALSAFAVLTSTLMLETIGLIAGLLPAIKASRLDPIEALRYE
ncbi:MAG TPA: ABC transporter permease [Bryobacteraceae bacterium]|nr:ABC transporter permease [Bryobacteraceae bacterium]